MKKFLLLLFLLPLVLAQDVKLNSYVNDYSVTLTPKEIMEIESLLRGLHDTGRAEYAIILIESLHGQDIESYAYKLAEGTLGESGKNNGLLLLIAINDRQYRFEVGRGLEPMLPDIVVGRIGREYLEPNFKQEKYAKGIIEASLAIKEILDQEKEFVIEEYTRPFISIGICFIIVMILILLFIHHKKHRPDADYFAAALTLGSMMKGKGGFSGGGFGGGSFGGGGASGGW